MGQGTAEPLAVPATAAPSASVEDMGYAMGFRIGQQILAELYAHSAKPEFIYRHQWQPHDMVFWDNRALIHLATGCPSHLRRRMHRTTIQGDVPF